MAGIWHHSDGIHALVWGLSIRYCCDLQGCLGLDALARDCWLSVNQQTCQKQRYLCHWHICCCRTLCNAAALAACACASRFEHTVPLKAPLDLTASHSQCYWHVHTHWKVQCTTELCNMHWKVRCRTKPYDMHCSKRQEYKLTCWRFALAQTLYNTCVTVWGYHQPHGLGQCHTCSSIFVTSLECCQSACQLKMQVCSHAQTTTQHISFS